LSELRGGALMRAGFAEQLRADRRDLVAADDHGVRTLLGTLYGFELCEPGSERIWRFILQR
jgi:hypothetical protein